MMIFKYILITTIVLLITGCSLLVPEPKLIHTIYTTKIIKVPVPCKVPKIDCNFRGSGFTPTVKLLECVTLQKRVLESLDVNITR